MLVRIINSLIKPEREHDYVRMTTDEGFPSVLRQPGCKGIYRLRNRAQARGMQIMTFWENEDYLVQFRNSDYMKQANKIAKDLRDPAPEGFVYETIYDVIPDLPKP